VIFMHDRALGCGLHEIKGLHKLFPTTHIMLWRALLPLPKGLTQYKKAAAPKVHSELGILTLIKVPFCVLTVGIPLTKSLCMA
jgi:hypothetical protein